ncbi:MAG: oxidoreductase-like domain-containing protein [Pseudomonadota bacterium]
MPRMDAVPDTALLDPELPPQPERPLANDCCGGGCADCVFTLYLRDMKIWNKEVKEIQRLHAEKVAAASKA